MRTTLLHTAALIRPFLSKTQFSTLLSGTQGEEDNYFRDKIRILAKLIEHMPRTYAQDGLGDQAVAYLHYFKSGADWYITEISPDAYDCFGLANLGHGTELGYIWIPELVANGAELDLHFAPVTLATLKEVA